MCKIARPTGARAGGGLELWCHKCDIVSGTDLCQCLGEDWIQSWVNDPLSPP